MGIPIFISTVPTPYDHTIYWSIKSVSFTLFYLCMSDYILYSYIAGHLLSFGIYGFKRCILVCRFSIFISIMPTTGNHSIYRAHKVAFTFS